MAIESPSDQRKLWDSFSRAIGAQLREHPTIRGASGLDHAVQAISVDDKTNRVIIFSAEPNPRIAALIQGDVQATMPSARVLVARPIIIDVSAIVRSFFKSPDEAKITLRQFKGFTDRFNKLSKVKQQAQIERDVMGAIGSTINAFQHVSLPNVSQWNSVFQQLLGLDWKTVFESFSNEASPISFSDIYNIDYLAVDRACGVCPIPLYEFQDTDWNLFFQGSDIESIQHRLKQLDIFQYFFPPPDQVALGLAERGLTKRAEIIEAIERSPSLGHPFGETELVSGTDSLVEMVDALEERNYVAEFEQVVEVTPTGRITRTSVKGRPRESFISKLLNRVNVNLSASPKDFLPPGHS
jgi:hypothetical protein